MVVVVVPGVLGHCDAAPGEDAVGGSLGDLDLEGKSVSDPYGLHLIAIRVQDAYPGKFSFYYRHCNDMWRILTAKCGQ